MKYITLLALLGILIGCTPAKFSKPSNDMLLSVTTYQGGCKKIRVTVNRGKAEEKYFCPARDTNLENRCALLITIDETGSLPVFSCNTVDTSPVPVVKPILYITKD